MTSFDAAHAGDKVQLMDLLGGWEQPVRILTEPLPDGPGWLSCRAITLSGLVVPVHASTSRQMQVLEYGPGGAR